MQDDAGFDNAEVWLERLFPSPQLGNGVADSSSNVATRVSRQSTRERERRVEMRDTDSVKRIKDAIGRWQGKRRGSGISHAELWDMYMDA